MNPISNVDEFYAFISVVIRECQASGANDIANQLEQAKDLGSSGLEIIGAMRRTLREHQAALAQFLPRATAERVPEAIAFVDRCYGSLS